MSKIKYITEQLLNDTSKKAKASTRLRMNHNFHEDYADPINRMLNALEPNTYCRPHKHEDPDKSEVFIVLRGKMAVLIFDEKGNVTETYTFSPTEGTYGIDIPPRIWHTLVCLETGSVAYEVKDGPYVQPLDKNFASWAPEEGSAEAQEYLSKLIEQLQ